MPKSKFTKIKIDTSEIPFINLLKMKRDNLFYYTLFLFSYL